MVKPSEDRWGRLRKRITEALIMAAQEQAIRTNHKAMIKTQENSKCRMCEKAE